MDVCMCELEKETPIKGNKTEVKKVKDCGGGGGAQIPMFKIQY